MSQYCKGVLSALEDDFSDSWMLHFFYAFWHLSPLLSPLCPYKIAHWRLEDTFGHVMRSTLSTNDSDAERLAYIIAEIIGFWEDQIYQQKYYNFRPDIHRISFQLTKGIKQKVIFAKSAAFCLAFLCDEGSTSPEARSITKIMGIDQRKRRKHPWRWRQLSPRRSLHNQLIVWRHYCCYRGNQVVVLRRLRAVKKMVDQCCGCGVELHIYTIREYLYEKWPNPYDPEGGERQGYLAVLDFLPRILSLSGRYEPLVTMCRKKCLASMSQLWPKKSRRARRAIERYLQRVDPQENI
ncbi:hypothetical protein CPC08DRAFT_565077 [Agrocybe pediades]|nr:hypothetical protein CPC08DRAFT_565077 [Agrocybe pediades]